MKGELRRVAWLLPFAVLLSAQSGGALYQKAESELRTGDLTDAERDFRAVASKEPNNAGVHANLGVIYMRRKQWTPALEQLHAAEILAPHVTGIRLNIGLANFRRGDYLAAVPPFESVLREQPGSPQAAYLLGICYFLLERYRESKAVLTPLWEAQSSNLQYLYALGIAAGKTGDADLESRSLTRLRETGAQSPQMHLLLAKAHLARDEEPAAEAELKTALQADPQLAFAHYYLGVLRRKGQDPEAARSEFLADAAIEPDMPFNFEELGNLAAEQGENQQAADYLRQALRLEPRLTTAHYSLAKVYRAESRYREALEQTDEAAKLDANSASLHYFRAQLLQKLHRLPEAKREFAMSTTLRARVRDDLEAKISGSSFREMGLNQ